MKRMLNREIRLMISLNHDVEDQAIDWNLVTLSFREKLLGLIV